GGFAGGTLDSGPAAGAAAGSTSVPSGFLVGPTAGTALTLDEVNTIVQQSRDAANQTRAAIRLPFTETARMVIAVGDVNGDILAVFRQSDATIFSLDVAIAKARNVAYFSGSSVASQDKVGLPDGTAITNRTISFGSQRFFPAGIDFAGPGPFRDILLNDASNPCSQGRQTVDANQSGIVFFPGSAPLFKSGVLVGGLGISGDGVEQDDFVTALGAKGFEPPPGIRADQFKIDGVRMPYLKFPRNPTNLGN
ncbi:MAG: heme-binding protein, partial [Nitrospinae bacterium]|nr:heme-binding protein [Nitrospinota bacterium]